MIDNFAVFILTHGRAHNVKTYKTLRKQGYTGPIYIIIDNEDKQGDEYRRIYGEQVIMFDKVEWAAKCDAGDNFPERNTVLYARNACFQIARDLGVEYFLELDDDYTGFRFKFNADFSEYRDRQVLDIDRLLLVFLDYYRAIPAITLAMGQNGDYLGGEYSTRIAKRQLWVRKAMNSFFCSVGRPFQFMGRMNDDVNTYTTLGNRGGLFLTSLNTSIRQGDTQSNTGGLSEIYLEHGTYVKSFYTVMYCPSCTLVAEMGGNHRRIHHRINWEHAVPKIMNEQYRKPRVDDGRP